MYTIVWKFLFSAILRNKVVFGEVPADITAHASNPVLQNNASVSLRTEHADAHANLKIHSLHMCNDPFRCDVSHMVLTVQQHCHTTSIEIIRLKGVS